MQWQIKSEDVEANLEQVTAAKNEAPHVTQDGEMHQNS